MKMLNSVKLALNLFKGSFINANNEIILIPKFNVYTSLNDVNSDRDFKIKLCEYFTRDCCKALRYKQKKRLNEYYKDNINKFNIICGTNFTHDDMYIIYTYLGNGIKRLVAEKFVDSNFDMKIFGLYCNTN